MRDPRFDELTPVVKVKPFEFNDTFVEEHGAETAFICKGEYSENPDTFMGVIIEFCEVTCLDWTGEEPEVIRDNVKDAIKAHFNTENVRYNTTINLI